MKHQFKDANQLYAINHGEGPALVSAGPGSGKTYVITNRIQNLINVSGVKPSKILVITFTKAAAAQMKDRFLKLSDLQSTEVTFGTFHSVYLSFLKYFNFKSIPKIIEASKQREIVSNILHSSIVHSKNIYFQNANPEDLISAVSFYKTSFFTSPSEYPPELFKDFYNQYEECLSAMNCMDYDDILIRTHNLFIERPDLSEIIQNKYDYILVDEFQDINKIQYDVLKMIINKSNNIFVVGDDDQSIYGFRGASPTVMKEFITNFPDTKIINLNINYRSKKKIVEAADTVISHNLIRINNQKHISFDKENHGIFKIKIYESREEQYEFLKNIYFEEINQGKSIAILVRTNKDIYAIKEYFETGALYNTNIPVNDNPELEIIGNVKAYLSFANNCDRKSIIKIISGGDTYLSKDIFISETVDLGKLALKYSGTYKGNQLSIYKHHFDILKKSSPFAFIMYLYNIVGFKQHILDKYSSHKKEINIILDNILMTAKTKTDLISFNESLILPAKPESQQKPNLNIITFHASKGLEYDTVVLPDVNEGKIPGRSSIKSDDTEEERRLFYVAMTRAKEKLIISCVKGNDSMRVLPSRFITEFL